jgi:dihydrofolate reductase
VSLPDFAIVVAADENDGIGRSDSVDLPWRLPSDMAHFKRVTSDAPPGKRNGVFMGRVTWTTIPPRFRPLPGRINLVLTSHADLDTPGALQAHTIEDGLRLLAAQPDIHAIFCVGGAAVYESAVTMPACTRIYLTRVHGRFDCDRFFHLPAGFQLTRSTEGDDGGLGFSIQVWDRG